MALTPNINKPVSCTKIRSTDGSAPLRNSLNTDKGALSSDTLPKDYISTFSMETSPTDTNVVERSPSPQALPPVPTTIPKFLTSIQKNKKGVYSYLSTSQDHHLQTLLQAYIHFKNTTTSLKQSNSLSTNKHLNHIALWIWMACTDAPPSWSNFQDYGMSVVKWWISLQPSWRVLEHGKNMREEGSFDCLCQPGINGLLNIVILA